MTSRLDPDLTCYAFHSYPTLPCRLISFRYILNSNSNSSMNMNMNMISLLPQHLSPQTDLTEVRRLLKKYPLPVNADPYKYGTAGFRFDAHVLPPIMVRIGVAAALSSVMLSQQAPQQSGTQGTQPPIQAVGVMVTASHNDESYNGVKLADVSGGMMCSAGEDLAVELVNMGDIDALMQRILSLQHQHQMQSQSQGNINHITDPQPMCVHIGRDTRTHSPALACLVVKTARAMGAIVVDHGVVTTPILHWCVQHSNPVQHLPALIPIMTPTVSGYQDLMAQSYLTLLQTAAAPADHAQVGQHSQKLLVVDCACGVGYPHLQSLLVRLESLSGSHNNSNSNSFTKIVATNAPGTGPLNEQCGSEHVQKSLEQPVWYEQEEDSLSQQGGGKGPSLRYCASLDGDSDRIVFFSVLDNDDSGNSTILLDGDKIACLICHFLQKQLSALSTAGPEIAADVAHLKLGVVQTAYANGASTAYLQKILNNNSESNSDNDKSSSSNVFITKTGVKYVHAAAHREFDIGVYFEANGHGTVLFNDAFYQVLAAADVRLTADSTVGPSAASTALQRLKVLPSLINQAVGDALSDLLLVDAILQIENMTIQGWNAMYTDFPSRQLKVQVRDRSLIIVNDNETTCLQPATVQTALDAAMAEFSGRAFVRPSGTEDVVRIYAEAADRKAADGLAAAAAAIVYQYCDGVGEAPPVFPASRM